MTTYSEIIDTVIQQIGRPNLLTRTKTIVNNLIYELHYTPQRGVILFDKNIIEAQATTVADQVHAFETPNRFQKFLAVRYDSVLDYKDKYTYAIELKPGPRMNHEKYYFYRNSTGHTMVNCGAIGSTISLAYYRRLAPLTYYEVGSRPATYDESTDIWTYLDPQPTDEAAELARQNLVTNWMIQEHSAVVVEGALAALWKEAGDGRSQATYSRYQSLRDGMVVEEQIQLN